VRTSNGAGLAFSLSCENKCFLYEIYSTFPGTMPITSIINCNYSLSLVPGKRGKPVNSSIMMHPMLHISIA
jgi:hypothetical protein